MPSPPRLLQHRPIPIPLLAAALLGLSACARPAPEPPVAEAAPPRIQPPPPRPARLAARPRHTDPCAPAKADLSHERKEALFRQFDATLAYNPGPATAATAPMAPAPPAADCRQAAR